MNQLTDFHENGNGCTIRGCFSVLILLQFVVSTRLINVGTDTISVCLEYWNSSCHHNRSSKMCKYFKVHFLKINNNTIAAVNIFSLRLDGDNWRNVGTILVRITFDTGKDWEVLITIYEIILFNNLYRSEYIRFWDYVWQI